MEPVSNLHTMPIQKDCYDLQSITEDDVIKQIGLAEPIPVDGIKIIQGQNVNATIGKAFNEINYLYRSCISNLPPS